MVKQLRQVAGVERVKVHDFKKGIFAVTPRKGAKLSVSAITEAVKRSGFTPQRIIVPGESTKDSPRPPRASPAGAAPLPVEIEKLLAGPQDAFREGRFDDALRAARRAAQKKPDDATIQQFVSLAGFALSKFEDASTAAHAALHHGPHWKWKRLKGHYAKTEVYTAQLRALEKFVREQPASAEARFLLAYHYLMLGHSQAARSHLKRLAEQKPDDKLVRQLLEPAKQDGDNRQSFRNR